MNKKNKKQSPLQNGEELKPIMIKPNMGRMVKPMAKFPDLSGDGKVTQKDILIGRGVIKKPKMEGGKFMTKQYSKTRRNMSKADEKAFEKAIKYSNKSAMSLSDLFCVERHKKHFLNLAKNKLDIMVNQHYNR